MVGGIVISSEEERSRKKVNGILANVNLDTRANSVRREKPAG